MDGTLDDMYDVRLGVVSEDVDDVKRAKATPLLCLPPLGDQVRIVNIHITDISNSSNSIIRLFPSLLLPSIISS